jgi:thiol-disulfide isomerase/thioredoxin
MSVRAARARFNQPVVRFLAAACLVGGAILALWQAGVLFQADDAFVASPQGLRLELSAADTSVATPGAGSSPVGPKEHYLAPDFEFSAFDGRRLRLSDYRGQAVVLNFWATWCGPCRVEMPDLEAALREYGPRGLAVIAVNAGERYEAASRWLDDVGVKLSAFAYDPDESVRRLYDVFGLPVSYFIDAQGRITRVQAGVLTPGIARSGIEEALAGSVLAPPQP